MKNILIEALAFAVLGGVLAFSANAISPRGLKLTRNYFPTGTTSSAPVSNVAPGQKLREKGLQVIETPEVSTLFRDPRVQQGLIVFIDARNTQHFEEGHIPGAYEFDHYHPEQYLTTVMPVCQIAEKIIVYCTGGDCEDSQFAAVFLRDGLGLPNEKIFVYIGGIHEWGATNLPLEKGERNSGKILSAIK